MYATILAGLIVLTTIIPGSVPRILGVVPEQPVAGLKPQSITVNGEDFRGGLTLVVTAPGGDVKNVSGPDVSNVGATTFKAMVTFERPGAYRLSVLNADGGKSDPFPVTVIPARPAPKPPAIDRVQPAEVARSQEVHVITIRGSGFEPGLKVSITDPTGTVSSKDVFDRVDPQVIVFRTTFEMSGSYALQVMNSSGGASNTVSITVR